ncbi:hypothetical protein [Granulicella tundricola]|uniref:Uncharacterized protein n=1 Tax=Granulicella tundricola (strain ATCC BAA-1859 / DSM 23138 / MP5ACTX9) TaxID=1198114 RepID=E8WVC5_GRATM|nr:hypothetical protein [Granulicella tundricola]ADW67300.1 hypothetical protein AciX9_0226 [Granulicella tundricola MP5ACTX9]
MTPSAEAHNETLRGYTDLTLFNLESDSARIGFDLTMTLANSKGGHLTLHCSDVQNLELNPNGEDFKRFLGLHIEDLREDGLERIRYSLEDLENEAIFLHCANIQLERPV